MKKIILALIPVILLLIVSGCSDNAGSTGTDPFGGGGGGGGTGNVAVQVSVVQDNQQQLYFRFTPNTAVFMTQITATCAAAGVNNESVTVNLTSGPNDPIDVGPIQNLQQGQQWQFTVTGNVGNQQGTAFTTNVNFTVP